ncbi:outer membrane immunogenic protein [Devosia enhydra]|uniref:Outer membrane immunogenic protein n=1 Tax=Devosia enhydra TaxID=665118 RepID=A0A1K2HVB1_9HYPH|nr:hypothetical protein [Devosia enhydra]SFZ82638.1 outer membrane immunogenic protein [Devosia enhydra]
MIKTARGLALAVALAAPCVTGASAADFFGGDSGLGPAPVSPYFNFEGFYLGGTLGAGALDEAGTVGTVGVVAGNNFAVTDAILAGAEVQAELLYNGDGLVGFDTLLLAKAGGYVSDNALLYGTAGGGWVDGDLSYAFGGGVEFAVTDQLGVRGEALGLGAFGGGPDGGKVSGGLLWHIR